MKSPIRMIQGDSAITVVVVIIIIIGCIKSPRLYIIY